MALCRITIHQREFRHIIKLALIAPSTLVPTTPLFITRGLSSAIHAGSADSDGSVQTGLSKVSQAAHIPNITKELHMMSSQKFSKAPAISQYQIQMAMDGIKSHSFAYDEADGGG